MKLTQLVAAAFAVALSFSAGTNEASAGFYKSGCSSIGLWSYHGGSCGNTGGGVTVDPNAPTLGTNVVGFDLGNVKLDATAGPTGLIINPGFTDIDVIDTDVAIKLSNIQYWHDEMTWWDEYKGKDKQLDALNSWNFTLEHDGVTVDLGGLNSADRHNDLLITNAFQGTVADGEWTLTATSNYANASNRMIQFDVEALFEITQADPCVLYGSTYPGCGTGSSSSSTSGGGSSTGGSSTSTGGSSTSTGGSSTTSTTSSTSSTSSTSGGTTTSSSSGGTCGNGGAIPPGGCGGSSTSSSTSGGGSSTGGGSVPVPASLLLILAGAAGIAGFRRKG